MLLNSLMVKFYKVIDHWMLRIKARKSDSICAITALQTGCVYYLNH